MTNEFCGDEPPHKIWFKKEQGRFLKKARLKTGLSVEDVARETGIDIRWVESGEVSLQMKNLIYLVRLYRIPEDHFMNWESHVRVKIRQMIHPRIQH